LSFLDTFLEMAVIFFGITMGYVGNKLHILGGDMDQKLSKLLVNLIVPCLLVGSVASAKSFPTGEDLADLLWVTLLFYVMQIVVALVLARVVGGTTEQIGVWRYSMMFSNTIFIGYPVLVALMGKEILLYAGILVMPANVMAYTLGPLLLTGAMRFRWQQMVSPCVVASVTALVMALGQIRLPVLVGECLNFLGDTTTPLSLLLVGSLLAGMSARQIFAVPRLWIVTMLRLIAIPFLFWLMLRGMPLKQDIVDMAVIILAMPVSMSAPMICMEFGGDVDCMTKMTFLSTVVSIFTIPLMAALLL